MSREITVNCKDCGFEWTHEIGNDWFEQEYPYCPGCCKDLTFNADTNDYH